jgi:integrase/recombinase XerD
MIRLRFLPLAEEVMQANFEKFIQERKYLTNVTEATVQWYTHAFKWLDTDAPSQEDLKAAVMRMRLKGLKATGCNSAIRALNSYVHWASAGLDVKCSPACRHPKIAQLKEPQCVLPTFSDKQIRLLVEWKPKGTIERRLLLIVLCLLDTGARIGEVLKLRVSDLNLDDLLVTLDGKGRKQRIVPFSFELRKALHRYITDFNRKPESLLFATSGETELGRRNTLRDVKVLCNSLGFTPPRRTLHATRHTFATGYLRRGGNVFALQRVMGHSDLETTKRYAHMTTADLQAMHERVSLLSR